MDAPFNAVFSNAALHWVKDADGVARALRPGGRFVVEMGGKGNVQAVVDGMREVMGPVETPWYYPSVGEYTTVLERHGFDVSFAALFDRPTRVEGEDGLEDWLSMFAGSILGPQTNAARSRSACVRNCFAMADGCWIIAGCG